MIKRKYITATYMDELICDKCGERMLQQVMVVKEGVPLFTFRCMNSECQAEVQFIPGEHPGQPHYEYGEEKMLPNSIYPNLIGENAFTTTVDDLTNNV